ncbi:hypothetical protein RJZ56_004998 [Blastomyces dermatitidis]
MVKGREPSQGPSVDSKANPKNSAREEISLLFPHPSFQFTPSLSLQRRSHQQNQPEDEQDQHHHRTPPGFHRRFQKAYKPGNEWFQIPGPDAIRYYEEELTRNDLGLDSEWEYADEFRRQLRKFVHLTEVEAYVSEYEEDEYGCDLRWKYQGLPSEENQWIYMGELGEGGFGYVQCWEWYPFGNRVGFSRLPSSYYLDVPSTHILRCRLPSGLFPSRAYGRIVMEWLADDTLPRTLSGSLSRIRKMTSSGMITALKEISHAELMPPVARMLSRYMIGLTSIRSPLS